MKHKIAEILPESIAFETGIEPGDFLISINGEKIRDVLDYRFAVQSEELLLEIEKASCGVNATGAEPDFAPPGEEDWGSPPHCGEIWEIEIEKDGDEDLGMVFARPLMDETRRCVNKCIFCFIDQQPPDLRDSLYIKDDDVRLSFLHGNYVTLTNLSDAEIRRIAGYHLSPLKISVHAADTDLRKKMMGCGSRAAENLFKTLQIFGDAGIKMHFQAVICKGVNDGKYLDETISALRRVRGAESLAIVPAGITRHREGLFPLEQFTAFEAKKILETVRAAQKICRAETGTNFVFASDEWYVLSGEELPLYEDYEDFPQLDNGVGMLRIFEREFNFRLREHVSSRTCASGAQCAQKIGIITGQAAEKFMRRLADTFESANPGTKITIHAVKNNFFGENITVSGLLTGTDIIAQLKGNITAHALFLPQNAFRQATETMLDGVTRAELADALGVPVHIGSADGGEFFKSMILNSL
ncbi:MAG: DUF512 domain-containing protein [Defluviitaleaceae bacterium]|nr:DUF512 domain-containing protein [Defluviitaleaceae bacterium]